MQIQVISQLTNQEIDEFREAFMLFDKVIFSCELFFTKIFSEFK